MKKALITILALALLLTLFGCGSKPEAQTDTPANQTAADPDIQNLSGNWIEDGQPDNRLVVSSDGSFDYTGSDGAVKGNVKVEYEEYSDGTKSPLYAFYQDGGEFWLGFYFEEGAELTELYSGQDGARHFVREAVG